MQQAARISGYTAYMAIVNWSSSATNKLFIADQEATEDYITGRFG
jgi:ABC-type phosphate transport system ATPase subunit